MSLLLAPDEVTLYPPGADQDDHGWALPGTGTPWQGPGSLQPQAGLVGLGADQSGGAGPWGPHAVPLAVLYLPPEAPVVEGCLAQVRGEQWHLSQVRLVRDPTGSGGLDCWAATASGAGGWPP